MGTFLYDVWFRDLKADPDDEDYEWVACLRIEAATEAAAKAWGDSLAEKRCRRIPSDLFLRSAIEAESSAERQPIFRNLNHLRDLPTIRDGEEATDDEIGW